MLGSSQLSFIDAIDVLKSLGEPTRLRLVRLLARSDLTVTDLTSILGQSQPRVSRHLKLLVESRILSRYQEGAWAYFRLADDIAVAGLVSFLLAKVNEADRVLVRDAARLDTVRQERAARAASYFAANAESWDRLRLLHAPDADVERALLAAIGEDGIGSLLDVGTGTGRLIELLADRCDRVTGIDASREMLHIARAKLDAAGITNALIRQGDCYHLPVPREAFDLVTIHQVLHYLDDPAAAVREAAATLRPGGRLVVVDFAPHGLEFLRDDHAHLRLGFAAETLSGYLEAAGLDVVHIRTLGAGGEGSGRLTVSLWLAQDRRPAAASASPARRAAVPSVTLL